MAKIFKRCPCPEDQWDSCLHQWVVRYRTTGGRSSRQREQSFGTILRQAEDFALKVEHDKRAHVFVDPKAGRALFRNAAETWLDQHLGADSSIATYRSVLRAHIDPAIGGKPIGTMPSAARAHVRATLATWRMSGLADVLELVVSELVANGVNASADGNGAPRYLAGRMPVIRLCLLTDGARLVAEVWDQAVGVPVRLSAGRDDESGRGLDLVDMITGSRWGWHPARPAAARATA